MWPTLLLEPGPGLLFTMHQLLNLTIQLQEIGKRGDKFGQSFYTLLLLLLNGTPTPSFIGSYPVE
jgi:hypothetical protein